MAKSLYICYFGVNEPLVQTQVIPYLQELVKGGHQMRLLTFEPGKVDETTVRTVLAEQGIEWNWLPYHKRFSAIATAWDIFRGTLFVSRFIRRERPDILHGRIHVPTLIGALARKFSRHRPKLLFDIRGFFPEEYVDGGVWPDGGILYRTAKRVERWLMKESDGFVVLTEKAREILFPESKDQGYDRLGRPVEVIPCCVDLERFAEVNGETRAVMRKRLDVENRRVITYVGSFGGWYLSDEMIDFLRVAREHDPNIFALILTQRDCERIRSNLLAIGFEEGDFFVDSVEPDEIPKYLSAADVAISFIKACYSKLSSSPTKIAEYLASGVPVISNRGIGDLDELIERNGIGVLLEGLDATSYADAMSRLDASDEIRGTCREVVRSSFAMGDVGGANYRNIYRLIMKKRSELPD